MKKLFISSMLILAMGSVSAQSFEKGTKEVQLGVGLGGTFGTPFSAAFEYGVSDKIGVQLGAGYTSVDIIGTNAKYILVNLGANYHFYTADKFDAYGGVFLGYNKVDYSGIGAIPSATYFGAKLGGRYYFTDSVGAFAELGYGLANLNVGVAIKF